MVRMLAVMIEFCVTEVLSIFKVDVEQYKIIITYLMTSYASGDHLFFSA
jgi:hypothetical protein